MNQLQRRMVEAKVHAQAVSKGEVQPKAQSETEYKIAAMSYAYEEMLGKYLHKPAIHYFIKFVTKTVYSRTNTFLLEAAVLADKHRVDYLTYIRAQFYWFDHWFRRAPKIHELRGGKGKFPAERRLLEYLELNRAGKINSSISSPVIPRKVPVVTPKILDKVNRQRLNQLCEVYRLTEPEALARFAPAGLFDLEWLRRQPQFRSQRGEMDL